MKLLTPIALLIGCLVFPSVLSAQIKLSKLQTRQLVDSLMQSEYLSPEQKIAEYKLLLQVENEKRELENSLVLILNTFILEEMSQLGNYVEIKTVFESGHFFKKFDKTNENMNIYVRLLSITAKAYLMLQEYENADKLISELQSYVFLDDITYLNKAYIFLVHGQFNVRTGKYKDGLVMLRLAMQAFEKSTSLSELDKRKKISNVLSNFGSTYYTLGDYENAIKYYEQGFGKAGNLSLPLDIVIYRHNVAISQLNLSKWQESLNTAAFASQQAREIKSDIFFAFSNEIIARAKHGQGESAEAIRVIQASIAIYKKSKYTQKIIEALAFEAEFNISLGNWNEARKSTLEAHALLEKDKNQAKPTLQLLKSSFLIEEKNKDFDKAIFYQKQLTQLKEDNFEVKTKQDAQRLMLGFELELAEEKSLRLEQENKLNSILIERNENKNKLLMTVIFATLAVLLLLVYFYMRERKLKMEMSHLAMTDHLTGCPNRRNAMFQAKSMLTNQVNKNDSMIIAILDVDNFKIVNDTYGHDVGDKVLQNLSSLIFDALRETDVIGRYGGEEFLLLLPNAGEKEIEMIFSRVQLALKNHTCEYKGEIIALPITVSIGASVVSDVPEQLYENDYKLLLDTIIKEADEKAYEAKQKGKDQLRLVTVSFST